VADYRRIARAPRSLATCSPCTSTHRDVDQRQAEDDPRRRSLAAAVQPCRKSRILVIDDEAAIRDSLRMTLEYEGYEFHRRGDGTGRPRTGGGARAARFWCCSTWKNARDGRHRGAGASAQHERIAAGRRRVGGTARSARRSKATKKGAFDFIEKAVREAERVARQPAQRTRPAAVARRETGR